MDAPARTHPAESSGLRDRAELTGPAAPSTALAPGEVTGPWAAGFLSPLGPDGALGSHGKDPFRGRGRTHHPRSEGHRHPGRGPGGAQEMGPGCGHPSSPTPHGHYQEFLPGFDCLLYFLNPLQEFLGEECRGGRSKQALLWAPPPSLTGERSRGKPEVGKPTRTGHGAGRGGWE